MNTGSLYNLCLLTDICIIGERSCTGLCEFESKAWAIEALILTNHISIDNPSKFNIYILILYFVILPFSISLRVMISVLASSAVDCGLSPDRVKLKTIKLVFVTYLLNLLH